MSEINTIDALGDNVAATRLIDKSIYEFVDDKLQRIRAYAFVICPQLVRVSFPAATYIGSYSFGSCPNLTSVILGNTSQVATLGSTSAFSNTPNAIIYVPDALVDSYKSATNWSTYADRIKGISELPEE